METVELKESFGTLSETINGLVKLGYKHDFNNEKECLRCLVNSTLFHPHDFQIDKVYRFEGQSNPEDQSILYAISSSKLELRGILVNGYGVSSDDEVSKLIDRVGMIQSKSMLEKKSTESTTQRPEGNRIIDAPLVEINLYGYINQIKKETPWKENDRNSLTIFKSNRLRVVLLGMHKNAELKSHKTDGVVCIQVLRGEIKFITDHEDVLLETGKMMALHSNINHNVKALRESFLLLTILMNR